MNPTLNQMHSTGLAKNSIFIISNQLLTKWHVLKIYKKFPYTIFFLILPTFLVISVISIFDLTKSQINPLNYYFHNMIG